MFPNPRCTTCSLLNHVWAIFYWLNPINVAFCRQILWLSNIVFLDIVYIVYLFNTYIDLYVYIYIFHFTVHNFDDKPFLLWTTDARTEYISNTYIHTFDIHIHRSICSIYRKCSSIKPYIFPRFFPRFSAGVAASVQVLIRGDQLEIYRLQRRQNRWDFFGASVLNTPGSIVPRCEPWCWYMKTYITGWFLGLYSILYIG